MQLAIYLKILETKLISLNFWRLRDTIYMSVDILPVATICRRYIQVLSWNSPKKHTIIINYKLYQLPRQTTSEKKTNRFCMEQNAFCKTNYWWKCTNTTIINKKKRYNLAYKLTVYHKCFSLTLQICLYQLVFYCKITMKTI